MLPDRHARPASLGPTGPVEQRGEAAPEPNPSHPSPNPAVAAGGKLWTDDDQEKADYFLNRDGWLPCFGCGSEGPYRRYGDHSYCATCIREGVPWADKAGEKTK